MNDSESSWILLARVVRTQGRHGEVLADIFTDFPQTLAHRKQLFLRPPAGHSPATLRDAIVESQWLHKGRVVLKFSQVDSMDQADSLRGFELITPREARTPLKDDAVYISDLLGLTVVDVSGGGTVIAGEITAVDPEGIAPAMLVIRAPDGQELLIPFVRGYLRDFDFAARRLNMELPPGLLEAQAPLTEQERSHSTPSERGEESE